MRRIATAGLGLVVALGLAALAVAPALAPEITSRTPAAARPTFVPAHRPQPLCELPVQETTLANGGAPRSVRFTLAVEFADPDACERGAALLPEAGRDAAAVVGALSATEAMTVEGKERAKHAISGRTEVLLGGSARVTAVYFKEWVVR